MKIENARLSVLMNELRQFRDSQVNFEALSVAFTSNSVKITWKPVAIL